MRVPAPSFSPEVVARKAKAARRRSRLFWPKDAFFGLQANVTNEAYHALWEILPDYWKTYRRCADPETRAKFRSYLRAKIAAMRILRQRL